MAFATPLASRSSSTATGGGHRTAQPLTSIASTPDEPEAKLPRAVADIGDFNQIIRNDLVNDPVSVSCRQKRPIAPEGIEHGRAKLGKIAEKVELGDDLVLHCGRQRLKLCLSPRKEFNPSWHVAPVWP